MRSIQFGACEFAFPCWGASAIKMAREAGFEGLQIADAGGYLQPNPGNNGYVEYERYGLDLRRKDSFPLLFHEVQADYLEAAEANGLKLISIYLYTLEHQGFIKYSPNTPEGQHCRESLLNGILAASQMGIPTVTVAATGMFGVAQKEYAFAALQYAAKAAEYHGVSLSVRSDLAPKHQAELVDALGERVKLSFDAYAPLVYGTGDPVHLLRKIGTDRIDHVRFRDSTMDREGFASFDKAIALLGQGKAPFQRTVKALLEMNYAGWVIIDTPYYHPDLRAAGESYSSAAHKDVEALLAAFAKNDGCRDKEGM